MGAEAGPGVGGVVRNRVSAARKRARWTEEEASYLRFEWGVLPVASIARNLGRTVGGTFGQAARMGLRAARETLSLNEAARRIGYSPMAVRAAMRRLGMRTRRAPSIARSGRVPDKLAILPEQVRPIAEELLEWSRRREWGVRGKPPACLRCRRKDKPHYARGVCQSCYRRPHGKVRAMARHREA